MCTHCPRLRPDQAGVVDAEVCRVKKASHPPSISLRDDTLGIKIHHPIRC
jgi:hypothetical protein